MLFGDIDSPLGEDLTANDAVNSPVSAAPLAVNTTDPLSDSISDIDAPVAIKKNVFAPRIENMTPQETGFFDNLIASFNLYKDNPIKIICYRYRICQRFVFKNTTLRQMKRVHVSSCYLLSIGMPERLLLVLYLH